MKQPVKVYILGSSRDRVMFEMKGLLEKCQGHRSAAQLGTALARPQSLRRAGIDDEIFAPR